MRKGLGSIILIIAVCVVWQSAVGAEEPAPLQIRAVDVTEAYGNTIGGTPEEQFGPLHFAIGFEGFGDDEGEVAFDPDVHFRAPQVARLYIFKKKPNENDSNWARVVELRRLASTEGDYGWLSGSVHRYYGTRAKEFVNVGLTQTTILPDTREAMVPIGFLVRVSKRALSLHNEERFWYQWETCVDEQDLLYCDRVGPYRMEI
jgi:hypothetical protein